MSLEASDSKNRIRVDPQFKRLINEIPSIRIKNGVEKKLTKERISSREMTRLLMKTPSWNQVIKEVSTLPRKEDLQ